MLYTPMTNEAMRVCYMAHRGQLDKSGVPYVFHPYHLAEQMTTEDEVCVALLHDVQEDTDVTEEQLRAHGFNERVLEALRLLTHDPRVPYEDYVQALASNPLARTVKIADLCHNSDQTRRETTTDSDRRRQQKYARALRILEGAPQQPFSPV